MIQLVLRFDSPTYQYQQSSHQIANISFHLRSALLDCHVRLRFLVYVGIHTGICIWGGVYIYNIMHTHRNV